MSEEQSQCLLDEIKTTAEHIGIKLDSKSILFTNEETNQPNG